MNSVNDERTAIGKTKHISCIAIVLIVLLIIIGGVVAVLLVPSDDDNNSTSATIASNCVSKKCMYVIYGPAVVMSPLLYIVKIIV